jgi:branched-chain amino acid aminotransferase
MPVITWKLSSLSAAGKPDLLLLPLESRSLDDASLQLPGGAYTTFRTFASRKVLHLQDHLARLEQTAALSGQPIHLDRAALRRALRQTITSPAPEADDWRIRLTLDLEDRPGDIYICLQPLETPPSEAYESGVLVTTIDLQRQLPKAKLTRFIARAGDVRQHLPAGVNEALMVDPRGCLLEGLSSNFFAVRAGLLYTAEEGVLSGITRSLVLQAAPDAIFPCAWSRSGWQICLHWMKPSSPAPAAAFCLSLRSTRYTSVKPVQAPSPTG